MQTKEQERTRSAWNEIATGYDEHTTAVNMVLGEEAIRRAGVGPGMRFLDVAAGSGALAVPAARAGADVLATDFSPTMIERLRERARKEGLDNLEARVMDGQALDLDDDEFDMAGSQFGVMLFPDLPQGLREMVRVTRPGGKVLMVVFGPPTEAEFLGFFVGALRAAVPGFEGLPTDPPPLPFQVADPGRLGDAMAAAGLGEIRIETVNHTMKFTSARHMWDLVTNSNPIGAAMVADLTGAQEEAAREVLDGMLRERSEGLPAALLDNQVHIAVGTP